MGHIIWCHLKRPNKTIQIANCMLHVKMFMQGKILLFYGPSNMHHVCIILYGPYQMESYDVSDKFRIASYKVLSMWFSWIQFLVLSSLVFLKRVESLFKSLWQFSVNIKLCCVTHVIWYGPSYIADVAYLWAILYYLNLKAYYMPHILWNAHKVTKMR